jgi:hypothetical protein
MCIDCGHLVLPLTRVTFLVVVVVVVAMMEVDDDERISCSFVIIFGRSLDWGESDNPFSLNSGITNFGGRKVQPTMMQFVSYFCLASS